MALVIHPIIVSNGQNRRSRGNGGPTDGSDRLFNPGRPNAIGYDGTWYYQAGFRFGDPGGKIIMPQGVGILSAFLTIQADPLLGNSTASVNWKIAGIDADDPPIWGNDYRPGTGGAPGRDPETTAKVDWDRSGQIAAKWYTTPDISSIVQELVDRPTWTPGNHMSFVIRNDGGTATTMTMAFRILDSDQYVVVFDCRYEGNEPKGQIMRMRIR